MATQNGTVLLNVIATGTPVRIVTAYKKRMRVRLSVFGGLGSAAYFATDQARLERPTAPSFVTGAYEVAGGTQDTMWIDPGEVLYGIAQIAGMRVTFNACEIAEET